MSGGMDSIIAAAPAASRECIYGTMAATNGVSAIGRPAAELAAAEASSTCRTSSPDMPSSAAAAALGDSFPNTSAACDGVRALAHMVPRAVGGWTFSSAETGALPNRLNCSASDKPNAPVPSLAPATTSDNAAPAFSGESAARNAAALSGSSRVSSAKSLACVSADALASIAAISSPTKSLRIAPAVPGGHPFSNASAVSFCLPLGSARSNAAAALLSFPPPPQVPKSMPNFHPSPCFTAGSPRSACSVPASSTASASARAEASDPGCIFANAGASAADLLAAEARRRDRSAAGRFLSSSYAAPRPAVRFRIAASFMAPSAARRASSGIASSAAAAASPDIAPSTLACFSAEHPKSARAVFAGGIFSKTAPTPVASLLSSPSPMEPIVAANTESASSSDISRSVRAMTSALPLMSPGDMARVMAATSPGAIAAKASLAFSSLIALTALAAVLVSSAARICAVALGYMPFIMRAMASGACPLSASAAWLGGSVARACAEAFGSSF
mmetsp:Transcript_2295/g.7968  ORF Transcript_2295/g.7968 Transcript_2295/m.7968 type:complete len:504 (-) Transcript_2295:864-2375(-)